MASSPKFIVSEGEDFEIVLKSRLDGSAEVSILKVDGTTGILTATVSAASTVTGFTVPASPTTITQTYSTTATTVPADTSHAITDSSGGTVSTSALAALNGGTLVGVDGSGSTAAPLTGVNTALGIIRNSISTLAAELALAKADALATKKVLNKLVDILQAAGLAA